MLVKHFFSAVLVTMLVACGPPTAPGVGISAGSIESAPATPQTLVVRFAVLDAEHAERYEKQTATRGILVNLDQAKMFVQNVANERMYNFHWKPGTLNPRAVIKGFKMMGVDTSNWE